MVLLPYHSRTIPQHNEDEYVQQWLYRMMFHWTLPALAIILRIRVTRAFLQRTFPATERAFSSLDLAAASSDKVMDFDMSSVTIQGPALPEQDTTTKRLFMVRHGEVINPGGSRPVFYGDQGKVKADSRMDKKLFYHPEIVFIVIFTHSYAHTILGTITRRSSVTSGRTRGSSCRCLFGPV